MVAGPAAIHPPATHDVFVTGGTGYLGRPAIAALAARGHTVRALARQGSVQRLPQGCTPVPGDALDHGSFARSVPPSDTLVHLVGTARPNPLKARQFRDVDLASVEEAVAAAVTSGVRHFVYVSVAQPAPVMRSFVQARMAAEERIRASGLAATFLRPWYVLGPGHRWPMVLVPAYALLERVPATREGARRLGFVTLAEMVRALVAAVESPPAGIRVLSVPEIRGARLGGAR